MYLGDKALMLNRVVWVVEKSRLKQRLEGVRMSE